MQLIRNPKDFYAGVLFMLFGLASLVISRPYVVGAAARMGPGYFPRILGVLLLVLGAMLSLRGFRATHEPRARWRWRPLVIVLLSVAFFTLTALWLGLVLAGMMLVLISSLASREFRWREALISGAVQGGCAVAVFVYGLGLPLPVWPTFFTGGQ